ncbi:MAG TPA: class I SAM-dependent methyltransferase [Gemmataceae bacterium]
MPLSSWIPATLRPAARRLKRAAARRLRSLRPARVDAPLPPSGCRAALELTRTVVVAEQDAPFDCPVRVRNLGSHVWSSCGRRPVRLLATWRTARNDPLDLPPARFDLPCPVSPGEEVVVPARVRALDALGRYLVAFELVQEPGARFSECGPGAALLDCHVTAPAHTDIDYPKVYATADLRRDYWTVVGPGTKEEFDRLSGVKLKHLIDLGLTPDSRLLDVGCGTGLLTAAAENFLSDKGYYLGTDLGAEAVEHCRRRFTRPNFAFVQSEMTRIPVEGMQFDMAVFYSVFTHTFPDETLLLLAEAKRLLAPGGLIFADLFTSPMVERYAGNRGAVEVNPDHFLRLAGVAGLRAELVMVGRWQRYAERMFFKFTPA